MVAIKASEADRFVAKPDTAHPIVLVFGPDSGLVAERAQMLIRASVEDPNDPFSLARIDADDLAAVPERLVEEAHTVPLFGGRRAVWVKANGRNILPALEALIAAPPQSDCRVVIEAGDLRRGTPLRNACERAKNVAAIACYADGERDLARLIDTQLRAAGVGIAADARALLMSLLGGDRMASRGEIDKLIIYAGDARQLDIDDILAVCADASATALDAVADAALCGNTAAVDTLYARAAANFPGGVILGAGLRQAMALHRMAIDIEAGARMQTVIDNLRPPLHFKRKPAIEAALKLWTAARLMRLVTRVADAVLETRRQAMLGDAIAQRTLLAVATAARGKS